MLDAMFVSAMQVDEQEEQRA